jgi:hypothetical protein
MFCSKVPRVILPIHPLRRGHLLLCGLKASCHGVKDAEDINLKIGLCCDLVPERVEYLGRRWMLRLEVSASSDLDMKARR